MRWHRPCSPPTTESPGSTTRHRSRPCDSKAEHHVQNAPTKPLHESTLPNHTPSLCTSGLGAVRQRHGGRCNYALALGECTGAH